MRNSLLEKRDGASCASHHAPKELDIRSSTIVFAFVPMIAACVRHSPSERCMIFRKGVSSLFTRGCPCLHVVEIVRWNVLGNRRDTSMSMSHGISPFNDAMSVASRGGLTAQIVGPLTRYHRVHKCLTEDFDILPIDQISLQTHCVCTHVHL